MVEDNKPDIPENKIKNPDNNLTRDPNRNNEHFRFSPANATDNNRTLTITIGLYWVSLTIVRIYQENKTNNEITVDTSVGFSVGNRPLFPFLENWAKNNNFNS